MQLLAEVKQFCRLTAGRRSLTLPGEFRSVNVGRQVAHLRSSSLTAAMACPIRTGRATANCPCPRASPSRSATSAA